jgi:GTP pyrophosphokinase
MVQPSRDWLNPHYGYLKTAKARQKVSHWFRSLDKDRQIQEGKILFEKLLKKAGYPLYAPIPWEKMIETQHLKTRDEFYHTLFLGELKTNRVLELMEPSKKTEAPVLAKELLATPLNSRVIFSDLGENVRYDLAACCSPIAGNPIVGLINRGRAMTVHKMSCPTIRKIANWDLRIVIAHWSHENPLDHYSVQLMTSQKLQPHFLQKVIESSMKNNVFCYMSPGCEDQLFLTQIDLFSPYPLSHERIKDILSLTFFQYGFDPASYRISMLQM